MSVPAADLDSNAVLLLIRRIVALALRCICHWAGAHTYAHTHAHRYMYIHTYNKHNTRTHAQLIVNYGN